MRLANAGFSVVFLFNIVGALFSDYFSSSMASIEDGHIPSLKYVETTKCHAQMNEKRMRNTVSRNTLLRHIHDIVDAGCR